MNKPFSNLINEDKDKDKKLSLSSTTRIPEKINEKSKPMIILGFVVSLSSIVLLLYTINNKFG